MTTRTLKTCVMCGRNEFERPGAWTYGRSNDPTLPALDICEGCAPDFDPAASYNPITAEVINLGVGCDECGSQRFVIETGDDWYQCARCGKEARSEQVLPPRRPAA